MKNETFKNYLIDLLIDEVERFSPEDIREYSNDWDDFSYKCLASYDADGTLTNTTEESQQLIKNNFEEIGYLLDDYSNDLGEINYSPFYESDAFLVCLGLYVASNLDAKITKKSTTKSIIKDLEGLRG